MIKNILVLICLFSVTAFASGGHDRGNGGYTILCHKPNSKPVIEALDLFEARQFGRSLMTFTEQDPFEIARMVINRLALLNKDRTLKFLNLIDDFKKNAVFLMSSNLPDVKDFGVLKIPNTCSVMPTIWQLRNVHDADPRRPNVSYYINNKIWMQLTPINQAALIVHEIITYEYLEKDSFNARISVGILFSHETDLTPVLVPDYYDIFYATSVGRIPFQYDRDVILKTLRVDMFTVPPAK